MSLSELADFAHRSLQRLRDRYRHEGLAATLARFPGRIASALRKADLRWRDPYAWREMVARFEGVKIGKNCRIFMSVEFLSEPYLVEIGDNVVVAGGVRFLTHDGSPLVFRNEIPEKEIYGKITIGSNVFVGMGAVFLPNTAVGDNCIIGAYSVVRSKIPPNSVVFGNPAKVVFPITMARRMLLANPHCLSRLYPSLEDQAEALFRHFALDPDDYDDSFVMKQALKQRLGRPAS